MAGAPNILISRPHKLGPQGIRLTIGKVAADMAEKYKITYAWEGPNVNFQCPAGIARGLRGTIYTGPTQVQIAIFLPLMLQSFKKSIDEGVRETLDARLASA